MNRREARECALCLIYSQFFNPEKSSEQLLLEYETEQDSEPSGFAKELFFGVCEKKEQLDALIADSADNWKLSRISKISLAVLRICVYELLYMTDIGKQVSINEALELARKYEDEKSVPFVNGVIAKIANK